jgi:hypothetical protein
MSTVFSRKSIFTVKWHGCPSQNKKGREGIVRIQPMETLLDEALKPSSHSRTFTKKAKAT